MQARAVEYENPIQYLFMMIDFNKQKFRPSK